IGVVSDDVAKAIGLDSARGAMVSQVEPGGPAAQAGVQPGDVIISFDGKDIKQMSDLPRIVGETKPGTRASMEVWRRGKAVSLKVGVGEMPSADDAGQAGKQEAPETAKADALGLKVRSLTEPERTKLNIKAGVQVVDVQGPAASAGISQGDV